MDDSDLYKIGLNKNEARVFEILIKNGPSIASEIVKISGFHRNIVYDNLEKLLEKGLVSFIIEDGKRKYSPTDPKNIFQLIEKEQKKLDEKKKLAEKLIPQLEKEYNTQKEIQSATLFRGKNGIKAILYDILNQKEYQSMGVSNASVSVMGEDFWKKFISEIRKRNISEKHLLNSDFDLRKINIASPKLTQVRILSDQFTLATEILIYGQKIAIMVYTENPVAVVIEDKNVRETFDAYFEFLWKRSERFSK